MNMILILSVLCRW